MPLLQSTPSPRRPWMPPRQRTMDLLSSPIEQDQERDLVDATDSSEGEENDGDSDMLDLEDFGLEVWTPLQTPILSSNSERGRSIQGSTETTRETSIDKIGSKDQDAAIRRDEDDEDGDDGLIFEEHDAFSSTKTSSDRFVRYSGNSDTPTTPSIATMDDIAEDDVGQGVSLTINAPEYDELQSEDETAIAANQSFGNQLLRVPGTERGGSPRPRQGTFGSGGSGSTVRPLSVIYSPSGALDLLANERINDFVVDEPPDRIADAQSGSTGPIQPFSLSIGEIAQLLDKGIGPPSLEGFQNQSVTSQFYDEDDGVTTSHIENAMGSSTARSSGDRVLATSQLYDEDDEVSVCHIENTIDPSTARNVEARVFGVGVNMYTMLPHVEGQTQPKSRSGEESPLSEEDWAEAVAKSGQPAEDTLMDELQDMLESTSTISHVAVDTEEDQNITVIFKPESSILMKASISTTTTLLGVSNKINEDNEDIMAIFSPQNGLDNREARPVRATEIAETKDEDMEDTRLRSVQDTAKPEILGSDPKSATFGHKLSTKSRASFPILLDMIKDTRTGSWIVLSDNLSRTQKKGIVLTIFLHYTTTLFASSLHLDYDNVFTSTSPVPHAIWATLFTFSEGTRLLEAQNQDLYASAITRTKSVLEEWRLSYGFPRVAEAYTYKDRLVSYTQRHSALEIAITRDLLESRNTKTERWLRTIFKLGKEITISGLMYESMVENVAEMVRKIYASPTGIGIEHMRTREARRKLGGLVVDEIGVLLEDLRLG